MDNPVIQISEKNNLTEEQRIELALNSILLNMGKVGILSVDREHPNIRFYIESAIQVAHFYNDIEEEKKLKVELENLKTHEIQHKKA